jgi:hypothetical protein
MRISYRLIALAARLLPVGGSHQPRTTTSITPSCGSDYSAGFNVYSLRAPAFEVTTTSNFKLQSRGCPRVVQVVNTTWALVIVVAWEIYITTYLGTQRTSRASSSWNTPGHWQSRELLTTTST